ncbi:MAG: hypothetical protein MRY64_14515 [Hyphomonadaceae bacterium]|nr:hypothetical protein [Hyphomonadaceae bacterium]
MTDTGKSPAGHEVPTRNELLVAGLAVLGLVLCIAGAGLVIFLPGTPTLADSFWGLILFFIGAVFTGITTVLPGEPQDLWAAWRARQSGPG